MRRFFGGTALALAMLCASAAAPAYAATPSSNDGVVVKYKTTPVLTLAVTPNYASGYGAYRAQLGTGTTSTVQTGSLAPGAIDFGSVYQGAVYLYKYAAHVQIKGNTAYSLYGEGSADLTGYSGAATGQTMSLAQSLFWLTSTSGGTDPNTGFSPATAFMPTTVAGSSYDNPTISPYTPSSSPVYTSTGSGDLYYDFQLHLPATVSTGSYSVYVVYTAVPQ